MGKTACEKCGKVHKPTIGGRPCKGHKKSYLDPDGDRIFYPEAERPGCTRAAMLGQDVCHSHGGATKQNRAAGKARETERRAAAMAARWGIPIEISGTDAILGQVHVWAGIEEFYRRKVQQLHDGAPDATEGPDPMVWGTSKKKTGGEDWGTTETAGPNTWIELHERASQNLVKFSGEAIRYGIEERRVRLAEQQGARVADVITKTTEGILTALLAAGLPSDLAGVFRQALAFEAPRHLRLLTG